MTISILKITLHLPWVHSLKEKRMVVKSICAKVKNRFNVSAAEVENQDIHQSAVLGFAGIAGDSAMADSIIDQIITFVEENTEGDIVRIERDIFRE